MLAPRGRQNPSLEPVNGETAGVRPVRCGRDHGPIGGTLDESARRLTHEELAVAMQLSSEGHDVCSLATRRGRGRTPDLLVCGAPVEVKSWLSAEERGKPPGARSVVNKLIQAEGQAAVVVLNGRGTGLSASDVDAGLRIYARLPRRANVAAVRVLGDTFDLTWARPAALGRDRPSLDRPGRDRPNLDRPGPDQQGRAGRDRWRRPEPGMSV